jgi:hypothetical protein
METDTPAAPNPLAVRHVAGRGWFVWSRFREAQVSRDFDTAEEAETYLARLRMVA